MHSLSPTLGRSRTQRNVRGNAAKRQKAPPSGGSFGRGGTLADDPVRPLPSLAPRRFDLQPELLGNVSADKSADAVILPVGRRPMVRLLIRN